MSGRDRKAKFVGSLLGVACGDVLGSAVEMQSRAEILRQYPNLLRDFVPAERSIGFGCYTDDTEMTLALARALIDARTANGAVCAAAYAEAFTPERGYGRSAIQVLSALRKGADWRQTGTMLFAEGSFGNGGAMRIAPIGLLYGHLDYARLYKQVKAAIWMTHSHAEAIDTALLQARAVGLMVPANGSIEVKSLIEDLICYAPESIMNSKLVLLQQLIGDNASAEQVIDTYGCGVRSADSWPPALWAALRHHADPEEAIVQAVNLGGDADTIGAMTGALVGALHGDQWVPQRWLEQLENEENGRAEIIAAAGWLAEISVS